MVTSSNYFLDYLWVIPLLPLASATLMLFAGNLLPKNAINFFGVGSVFLSFLHAAGAWQALSTLDANQRVFQQMLFGWATPGASPALGGQVPFIADWGYLLDPLSGVMVLVIAGVGLLVHVYSMGFMRRERGYYRFFAYLNLLIFCLLTLVLANNLLLLFAGWGGVSLTTALLTGFRFQTESACRAGRRILAVNGVADAGLLLGILLVAVTFGTVRFTSWELADPVAFSGITETLGAMLGQGRLLEGAPVLTVMALLLLVGAAAKSALFPLGSWLNHTSGAPAPVGAMIQSTGVTAGVYLMARMNAVYQLAPLAMAVVAFLGALTAILAAVVALVQTDLQEILTSSTISQLGYVFLALGAGAFSAGIFHLTVHALVKSLLCLAAGSVIHALSGERDIRKMGGLWDTVPAVSGTFLIAALAIAGLPPLAGFFSVGDVSAQLFWRSAPPDGHLLLWTVGLLITGTTALYTFRVLFLVFFGLSRVPPKMEQHIVEVPKSMTIPLAILAALSIGAGWFALPMLWGGPNLFGKFLAPVFRHAAPDGSVARLSHQTPAYEWLLMALPAVLAALGIWLAYSFDLKRREHPSRLAAAWPRLDHLLVHNDQVDELYDLLLVRRIKDLSVTLHLFDERIIDGFGVRGPAWLARAGSRICIRWDQWFVDGLVNFCAKFIQFLSHPVRMLQTGVLSTYAVFALIGLLVLLIYYSRHLQLLVHNLR